MRILKYIIYLVIALIVVSSCSTTKKLGEDEELYVGVKKMQIVSTDGAKISPEAKSEVRSSLNVKPNNPSVTAIVRYGKITSS